MLFNNKDLNKKPIESSHLLSHARTCALKEIVPGLPSQYKQQSLGPPGFYDSRA